MNKKFVAVITLFFILTVGLVYIGINLARAGINIPNTKDSIDIQDVIHHVYTVYRGALRNGGDVSEFDQVFINTSDYTYENEDVRDFVNEVMGPEAAKTGGYLTVMQAKYKAYGCSVRALKETEQLIKKEDREITSEDIKNIQGICYGIIPPSLGDGTPPKLDFKQIDIDNDRAVVRYDDGAALLEAILVRVNNQWRIANIKPIDIHF